MTGTRLVKRLSIGAYLGLARFCFALKPAFGLTGLKNQQFVRAFFLPRRAQDARARSAVTSPGWRWIVEAHREGRRYMVHSDELLSAFWSGRLSCGSAESQEDPIVSDHHYNFIHSNAEYGRNR